MIWKNLSNWCASCHGISFSWLELRVLLSLEQRIRLWRVAEFCICLLLWSRMVGSHALHVYFVFLSLPSRSVVQLCFTLPGLQLLNYVSLIHIPCLSKIDDVDMTVGRRLLSSGISSSLSLVEDYFMQQCWLKTKGQRLSMRSFLESQLLVTMNLGSLNGSLENPKSI